MRVLQFLRNVGKVCKKWENIKVLVLRSRSVESFQKTKLPEDLCREIENQLFVFSSNR